MTGVSDVAQMVRKQLYLKKEQDALLKYLAKQRGISEAEVVREALERLANESKAPETSKGRDPLLDLIGLIPDGPPDLAENHDKYLYGRRDDR